MSLHGAVSFEDIRPRLNTLDWAREQFAATEPLAEHVFPTSGAVNFQLSEGWADVAPGAPAPAYLDTPGGERYQLTKQSILEAGAYAGMPREWAQGLPPAIHNEILNWKFRGGLGSKEFKVLSQPQPAHMEPGPDGVNQFVPDGPSLALAMCRGTITPFSNLQLLDAALSAIHKTYGEEAEVLVDAKFSHSLERTNLRLVVPGQSRVITGTRVEGEDTWCTGISLANSLIGVSHPGTRLDGYLFRWWCTNGNTEQLAQGSGKLGRRSISDPADAYEWARRSVEEILGDLEGTFDLIQQLTQIQVTGDVNLVLGDLFTQYAIPVQERNRIIEMVADLGGDISLYDLHSVITMAANAQDLNPRTVDRLLELGGHVPHAATGRCNGQFEHGCRRLIPEGWHIPEPSAN